jgi:hypothetical protein
MEINESKLIEHEVRLRKLRLSKEVLETKRSTIRWLALSLGVINPGESRQGAIPVLDAIFNFQFVQKKDPSVPEISEYITAVWEPINDKTLRYHLLQLKKAKLVDNSKGKYYLQQQDGADKYDESAWISGYLESQISIIKPGMVEALRQLKSR